MKVERLPAIITTSGSGDICLYHLAEENYVVSVLIITNKCVV